MSKLQELIQQYCPDGVEYKKFSDIAEYVRGVTYSKSDEVNNNTDNGIPILRANNIILGKNILNFEDVKFINFSVKIKSAQYLRKNDILICAGSGSKEHIGKVAYIHKNIPYVFGGFMAVIRTADNNIILPRYLFHNLVSSNFRNYISVTIDSSTINNLNAKIMADFSIPVPPLEVQAEIVRILDTFTELQTKLEEELTARQKQYEYYRDSLLNFNHKIDGVQWVELQEIFDIRNGYTPSKKNPEFWDNGDIAWFRLEDIRTNGRILYNSIQHITKNGVKKSGLFPKNSIMLSTTATIGEHALIKVDYLSNQQITNFTIKNACKNSICIKFAFYYFYIIKKQLDDIANYSGGIPIIDQSKLKKLQFPLPPLDVQQRIVEVLDNFEKICTDLKIGLPAEINARKQQYEYYRDKLLTFERKN